MMSTLLFLVLYTNLLLFFAIAKIVPAYQIVPAINGSRDCRIQNTGQGREQGEKQFLQNTETPDPLI